MFINDTDQINQKISRYRTDIDIRGKKRQWHLIS